MKKPRRTSPAANPRDIALRAVLAASDPFAPGVVEIIESSSLSDQDRALARELACGVLRQRRWLDHALRQVGGADYKSPKRGAREALYLAAYQHLFLDRVPAHAIVHEAVRQVRQRTNPALAGWANVLLRRLVETAPESLRPRGDELWTLRHSVPDWLAEEQRRVISDEAELEAFFAFSNQPAPLVLRPADPSRAEEALRRVRAELPPSATLRGGALVPEAMVLEGAHLHPPRLSAFRDGLVTVEDEGAQAALLLATSGAVQGRVLDLCAAPGGKTAHLAAMAAPGTEIVATDVSEEHLALLRDTLKRLRVTNVAVGLAEEVLREAAPGSFDLILVDAPCSGLGTLRRHPEARERRSPEGIAELATLQTRLLASVAPLLRPGGVLAYTVCTVTRQEGEDVAERFLAAHGDFAPAPAPEGLPFDSAARQLRPGLWRLWPHREGCDGFTIGRFLKADTGVP